MVSCLLPQCQQGQQLLSSYNSHAARQSQLGSVLLPEGKEEIISSSKWSMALRLIVQEEGTLFLPDHSSEERSNSLLWPGSRDGMLSRLGAQ